MAIDALNNIQHWNISKKLTFAYLTCERLYPNYTFFHKNFNFGNPGFLRDTIDLIHQAIFELMDKITAQSLINKLQQYIPPTEKYNTVLVSAALDACTAIEAALLLIIDNEKDPDMLKHISTMATDSVDMYIQERDNLDYNTDKDFDQKIQNDTLMQRELKIQNGIILFLNKIDTVSESDITTLLQLQDNNGKSNLDLK